MRDVCTANAYIKFERKHEAARTKVASRCKHTLNSHLHIAWKDNMELDYSVSPTKLLVLPLLCTTSRYVELPCGEPGVPLHATFVVKMRLKARTRYLKRCLQSLYHRVNACSCVTWASHVHGSPENKSRLRIRWPSSSISCFLFLNNPGKLVSLRLHFVLL